MLIGTSDIYLNKQLGKKEREERQRDRNYKRERE